jgi:hypothetical protein
MDWNDIEAVEEAPKGLGSWEWRETELPSFPREWVYVTPSGLRERTGNYGPEPPPLPKPNPARTRDNCGQCGTMHWVEIHGWADGYCTYCYHRG